MSDLSPEFEKPLLKIEKKIKQLEVNPIKNAGEISSLKEKLSKLRRKIFTNLTPFQRVQLARHPLRPLFSDYISGIFTGFIELHGDRLFADDAAIIGGLAELNGVKCAVIGQEKGKNTTEKLKRNFGMPNPEGYRKALRIMKLAEKFSLPVFTFIDTPGAHPGIGAEERGQARAIAVNLEEMMDLQTPVISVVIGEGGSGGALALGVSNYIMMLANSIYSVISPEGCASILFRDASKSEEAAKVLKLTAQDILRLGVIDEIVSEPMGGAHLNPPKQFEILSKSLTAALESIKKKRNYAEHRYKKFRQMGEFKT
ncbi:acetyl-CoA carboxylase carboxyltransferase subunit alpha [bacterium]|nr:acetyl-CoA carboxylase carboxyltransferase subunit alpha [bacterium]MBU3956379.1 acetyl-CoA carboxylase carboxyltransferase subunit alpha [bacterium]